MVGDQDVLTALLGSERFRTCEVKCLRRGRDIIYNFGPSGYTARERIANLSGPEPPFVHCSGPKPWEAPAQVSLFGNARAYYARLGLELADYSRVARRYRPLLDTDNVAFDRKTLPARICCWLAGKRVPLQGLPLAIFHGIGRRINHALGFTYWRNKESNLQPGERPDGEAILAQCERRALHKESGESGDYRMTRPGISLYSNRRHSGDAEAAPGRHGRKQGILW